MFDYINFKFLHMTLKLDDFAECSKMFFQHIQSQIELFQEGHLEQQWKYGFEEQISEFVLREFLKARLKQRSRRKENLSCCK